MFQITPKYLLKKIMKIQNDVDKFSKMEHFDENIQTYFRNDRNYCTKNNNHEYKIKNSKNK